MICIISQEYSELKPIYEKILELFNLEKSQGETMALIISEKDNDVFLSIEIKNERK
jgi:hypothetical protein